MLQISILECNGNYETVQRVIMGLSNIRVKTASSDAYFKDFNRELLKSGHEWQKL